jgi:hypothetical protein
VKELCTTLRCSSLHCSHHTSLVSCLTPLVDVSFLWIASVAACLRAVFVGSVPPHNWFSAARYFSTETRPPSFGTLELCQRTLVLVLGWTSVRFVCFSLVFVCFRCVCSWVRTLSDLRVWLCSVAFSLGLNRLFNLLDSLARCSVACSQLL